MSRGQDPIVTDDVMEDCIQSELSVLREKLPEYDGGVGELEID